MLRVGERCFARCKFLAFTECHLVGSCLGKHNGVDIMSLNLQDILHNGYIRQTSHMGDTFIAVGPIKLCTL